MTLSLPNQSTVSENKSLDQRLATISSVDGSRCLLDIDGVPRTAAISTHLLCLHPGQRVVAINGGESEWLVIAAWPTEEDEGAFRFDAQSGVLHIEAPRLKLAALGSVKLHCGDARISLGIDGKIEISGAEVLSSALRAHRIEGATIDLN
jgi:hypothetical protein